MARGETHELPCEYTGCTWLTWYGPGSFGFTHAIQTRASHHFITHQYPVLAGEEPVLASKEAN